MDLETTKVEMTSSHEMSLACLNSSSRATKQADMDVFYTTRLSLSSVRNSLIWQSNVVVAIVVHLEAMDFLKTLLTEKSYVIEAKESTSSFSLAAKATLMPSNFSSFLLIASNNLSLMLNIDSVAFLSLGLVS